MKDKKKVGLDGYQAERFAAALAAPEVKVHAGRHTDSTFTLCQVVFFISKNETPNCVWVAGVLTPSRVNTRLLGS